MRLVQLAVLHIILASALFTETSGKRTCWFHKKTRTGEECRGTMRRINAAIGRYVGVLRMLGQCKRHWTRVNREANRFCACPLPVHSDDIHSLPILERLHQMFDWIRNIVSGYCPGVRWCCRCRNTADEVFNDERDYSPPEQVS